jgi:hypothetical protein
MTDTERYFIEAASSYINGVVCGAAEGVDPSALSSLAHIHKMTPVIYSSISSAPGDSAKEIALSMKRTAVIQASGQTAKSRAFLKVYSRLAKSGINAAVVKGIVLRELWREPDLRLSSDEDILVPADRFDEAADILLSLGLEERVSANEETNVRTFTDKTSGLAIELHNSLFPHTNDLNEKMASFFEGTTDNLCEMIIDGCKIYTLDPTYHLLFLILHSFKHFIYCGFGVRQICDFIVYARANKNSTNVEYIIDALRSVNALGFFDCILKICAKYFGVQKEEIGFGSYTPSQTDEAEMMEDVISGGAYGNSSPERIHSSVMTMTSAEGGKGRSFLFAIFPPYSIMKERYRFVSRHKILLPAGWIARIASRAFSSKEGIHAAESIEIGRRRVEMLKQYGVIK